MDFFICDRHDVGWDLHWSFVLTEMDERHIWSDRRARIHSSTTSNRSNTHFVIFQYLLHEIITVASSYFRVCNVDDFLAERKRSDVSRTENGSTLLCPRRNRCRPTIENLPLFCSPSRCRSIYAEDVKMRGTPFLRTQRTLKVNRMGFTSWAV